MFHLLMLIFGDKEGQDSLSYTNLRATRLRWSSVSLLAGEGR